MIIEKFFGTWCNPCKALNPIFDELKQEYPDIEFRNLDVDENHAYAVKNKIRSVPNVIFKSDNGEELDRIIGLSKKEEYVTKIKNLL